MRTDGCRSAAKVSENSFAGSAGGSPEGMAATVRANRDGVFTRLLFAISVGRSPTKAGESPALPISQTRADFQIIPSLPGQEGGPDMRLGFGFDV